MVLRLWEAGRLSSHHGTHQGRGGGYIPTMVHTQGRKGGVYTTMVHTRVGGRHTGRYIPLSGPSGRHTLGYIHFSGPSGRHTLGLLTPLRTLREAYPGVYIPLRTPQGGIPWCILLRSPFPVSLLASYPSPKVNRLKPVKTSDIPDFILSLFPVIPGFERKDEIRRPCVGV